MSYCPESQGPLPLAESPEKEEETEVEEEKREDQEEKKIAADVAVVSFEEAFTKSVSFWAQFTRLLVLEMY